MPEITPVGCCGKPRASRFCPDCGKQLDVPPLFSLLAHCRQAERKLRSEAARDREIARDPKQRDRTDGFSQTWEAHAAHADERADKWKAWVDALAELIERDRSAKPD